MENIFVQGKVAKYTVINPTTSTVGLWIGNRMVDEIDASIVKNLDTYFFYRSRNQASDVYVPAKVSGEHGETLNVNIFLDKDGNRTSPSVSVEKRLTMSGKEADRFFAESEIVYTDIWTMDDIMETSGRSLEDAQKAIRGGWIELDSALADAGNEIIENGMESMDSENPRP